jgi:hypothetical protein
VVVVTVQGLLTSWTEARRLLVGSGGLTSQALVEHFFGEDLPDVEEEIFDVGKGGAPGGPLGPIELIDKVFGDAFDVRADLIYQRTPLFLACHLPFLSQVASNAGTSFPKSV